MEVQSNKARKQGAQFLTPVDITNTGSATARMVNLEILTGAEPQEIEIALIGQNETVSYVIATDDPLNQTGHRIVSYEAP
ncbi:hypothetical protein [Altererythrobacter aquiaggeris]|uniref:hypothetical protein n=1 Tax=Aestuarierythrobacter aquiaggeris TaxID=1898396 RepID=UPI003018DC88